MRLLTRFVPLALCLLPGVCLHAQNVHLDSAPAAGSNRITINTKGLASRLPLIVLTTRLKGKCGLKGKRVALLDGLSNSTSGMDFTTLEVKGTFKEKDILCARVTDAKGTSFTSEEVTVLGARSSVPPVLVSPSAPYDSLIFKPGAVEVGASIAAYSPRDGASCGTAEKPLPLEDTTPRSVDGRSLQTVLLEEKLVSKQRVCLIFTSADSRTTSTAVVTIPEPQVAVDFPRPTAPATSEKSPAETVQDPLPVEGSDGSLGCDDSGFNDCHWGYTAIGGIEQSGLSSQDNQTDGFVQLFIHGPLNPSFGTGWLQIRLLGAPSQGDNKNIVTQLSDPAGQLTSGTLSSVGYAVDYMMGYQKDFHRGNAFTFAPILGFGATTTLSSKSPTVAYAVPLYGTNECDQLLARFGSKSNYSPSLPGSAAITTTTTASGGTTPPPSPTTSPMLCSVNNRPTSTASITSGVTTTTAVTGTQITNVAFSPEDRSSFLLKWAAGVRLINRYSRDSNKAGCKQDPSFPLTDDCNRSVIDLTLGQDQAITAGVLRHLVFKSNASFHIPKTNFYVLLSAANRFSRDESLPPLTLTPTPPSFGSATPAPGAVAVPSPSVFVLPFKQPDRDFYRIGIAVDLAKVMPGLFGISSK